MNIYNAHTNQRLGALVLRRYGSSPPGQLEWNDSTRLEVGSYFLEVRTDGNHAAEFTLTLKESPINQMYNPPLYPDLDELNDTPATATALPLVPMNPRGTSPKQTEPISGLTLYPPFDTDWYAVELSDSATQVSVLALPAFAYVYAAGILKSFSSLLLLSQKIFLYL